MSIFLGVAVSLFAEPTTPGGTDVADLLKHRDFCNIDEAVELTGWTKSTLYSKVNRRQIPSYRLGRSLRFKRVELLALFRERPALRPLAEILDGDGGNGGEQ